jgi:hypothetical protein
MYRWLLMLVACGLLVLVPACNKQNAKQEVKPRGGRMFKPDDKPGAGITPNTPGKDPDAKDSNAPPP